MEPPVGSKKFCLFWIPLAKPFIQGFLVEILNQRNVLEENLRNSRSKSRSTRHVSPQQACWKVLSRVLFGTACSILLKPLVFHARMRLAVVAALNGCEIVALDADPSWQKQDVLAAVPKQADTHHFQRRLFLGDVELQESMTLAGMGVTSSITLTLILTPPSIATVSEGGTAKLWSASSGEHLCTLQGHAMMVFSAVFSPDGQEVLTASMDCTAKLWSRSSGECLRTLQGHGSPVMSAVFSPDGQEVLTASFDCTAKIWSRSSGECLRTLHGHEDRVMSAIFSPG